MSSQQRVNLSLLLVGRLMLTCNTWRKGLATSWRVLGDALAVAASKPSLI